MSPRIRFKRSAASVLSNTVKSGRTQIGRPKSLSIRLATAWNVPPQTRPAAVPCARRPARASISRAALLVNVSNRIRSGATPPARRCATRQARVMVFPVPAPATTSKGEPRWMTASRWAGLSPSSHDLSRGSNMCSESIHLVTDTADRGEIRTVRGGWSAVRRLPAQIRKDLGIQPSGPRPPLFEVLPAHVLFQRLPEVLAGGQPAQAGQHLSELIFQRRVDRDQVLLPGALEVQPVPRQEGGELLDGLVVMVDPKVDVPVVGASVATAGLGHEDRRGFLPPSVTSRSLPPSKGRQE